MEEFLRSSRISYRDSILSRLRPLVIEVAVIRLEPLSRRKSPLVIALSPPKRASATAAATETTAAPAAEAATAAEWEVFPLLSGYS